MARIPTVATEERGSLGAYLALYLVVVLLTIGVLAAFQQGIESSTIATAQWLGLGWLLPIF
ncbi:MAG: hypothetical protein ACYC5O_14950 [Anaerolineae bacterium]